jgi:hypothetical protein
MCTSLSLMKDVAHVVDYSLSLVVEHVHGEIDQQR